MVCSQEAGLAVGPDANECTLQLSLQSSLMDHNTGHDTTFSVTYNTDGWPIVISGLPKGDLKGQKLYLLFVDETGTAVLDQIYIEVLAGPIGPPVIILRACSMLVRMANRLCRGRAYPDVRDFFRVTHLVPFRSGRTRPARPWRTVKS